MRKRLFSSIIIFWYHKNLFLLLEQEFNTMFIKYFAFAIFPKYLHQLIIDT